MHNRTLNALQFDDITVTHTEGSTPDYTVLWSPTFQTGVAISSSEWTTESSRLTISNESNDADTASARFSTDVPGQYSAVNKIVDTAGDTAERLITFIFYER